MAPDNNRFLIHLNGRWRYNRRVPKQFYHVVAKRMIRQSLKTKSIDIARMRRDALEKADDKYWNALALETLSNNGLTENTRDVAEKLYKAAVARALIHGFAYKPIQTLIDDATLDDVVARLRKLDVGVGEKRQPSVVEVEALLGTAPNPTELSQKVSSAFQLYVDKIAFDAQFKKSDAQKKSWEKAKRTSINYFIDAIGDINMADITRDHAIKYRNWWMERITQGDPDGNFPIPYTANRHIGNIRTLYREFYEFIGDEFRENPFRKLSFKDDKSSQRASFEDKWVRERILVPGLFDGLNEELRTILYVLIETGARMSEICSLEPDNIFLDCDIPYISIRAKAKREVKSVDSNRDIPLVGVALEAMKCVPAGFPKYMDKNLLVSASLMKAFKNRKLLPTKNHVIYSLRHSFEDRMLEAGIDYDLRCALMGHKNERPKYGQQGSLKYRRDELLKIAHPFSSNLF